MGILVGSLGILAGEILFLVIICVRRGKIGNYFHVRQMMSKAISSVHKINIPWASGR